MKRMVFLASLAGCVLLIGGCSLQAEGATPSTPSSLTPSSLTSPPLTDPPPSTASTTNTTVDQTTRDQSTTSHGSATTLRSTTSSPGAKAVADGSGCTPGPGSLPDGTWFGFVDAVDSEGFSFDLACFFSGRQAELAADEDGEESPPPNDYYIRNTNSELRELEVAKETGVTWYPDFGAPDSEAKAPYSEWTAATADRGFDVGVWVEVKAGRVRAIAEQWVP